MTDLASQVQSDLVYYVYAVARPHDPQQTVLLPTAGIIPQSPVYAVPWRDLVAMTSAVPLADFGAEALPVKLEDLDWTCARVLAHQETLAQLMVNYTIVPLKFCTLYTTEDRVRDMVETHYAELDRALERLYGATEWGIKVYCDRRILAEWVERAAPEVQVLRSSMANKSEGAAFFIRKRLEKLVTTVAEHTVDPCLSDSYERLRQHARETCINQVQAQNAAENQPELVANVAYLVDNTAYTGFTTALDQLVETYTEQGFRYELTGPWPPYNFA